MTITPLIFAIPRYEESATELARELGGELGLVERARFPDGERYQRLHTSVRGRHVLLVAGTIDDDATLTAFDLACAIVQGGASRLGLIIPYYGYSTMERAVKRGEVVTAKTRARLLSALPPAVMGTEIFLLDLHADGIQYSFEGPINAHHVSGSAALVPLLQRLGGDDFVLASTDAGRAKTVQRLANQLGVDAAFILKRRESGSRSVVTAVTADVSGRRVVLYDDLIRTGGSLLGAARAYAATGAASLCACCSHGVFPGEAWPTLCESGLFETIAALDSHPRARELAGEGLELVSTAPLFADVVRRSWLDGRLSEPLPA